MLLTLLKDAANSATPGTKKKKYIIYSINILVSKTKKIQIIRSQQPYV